MRMVKWLICLLFLPMSLQAGVVSIQRLDSLLQHPVYHVPAEVVQPNIVELSSQLQARINELSVRVGDSVTQGQTLVALDCRDAELQKKQSEAQLARAQSQVRFASQQLQRAERLLKQRNASRELFDQRKADLSRFRADRDIAQVSVSQAELTVSRCVVKSPFNGVVVAKSAVEGELATVAMPMLTIQSSVDEELIAYISPDQADLQKSGQLWFQYQQQRYPVTLRTLLPRIEKQARSQQARLMFSEQAALPGSQGRLYWKGTQALLPARYLLERKGKLGLMIANSNGIAEFIVLPNAKSGQPLIVDLAADLQVIVEGQHALETGDQIELMQEPTDAPIAQ